MLQGVVIRGTTPKHEFGLPYPMEAVEDFEIVYGQNKKILFRRNMEDCTVENGVIAFHLTQEETFSLSPKKYLDIEIRIKLMDGMIVHNDEPIVLRVQDTMYEEVMD